MAVGEVGVGAGGGVLRMVMTVLVGEHCRRARWRRELRMHGTATAVERRRRAARRSAESQENPQKVKPMMAVFGGVRAGWVAKLEETMGLPLQRRG